MSFFQEIINCLEYLHSLNIAHRDIKPENLLLCKIKNKLDLKLIDFGISNCYTMYEPNYLSIYLRYIIFYNLILKIFNFDFYI